MSRLRYLAALLAMLTLSLTMSFATTASAATMSEVLISADNPGKLQSFSKDEYYIRAGGTPPTLEALAAEPGKYFRHQMAYEVFKKGFEIQLGRDLSGGDLKRLLSGNKVRLVACEGSIYTTGVDRDGNVSWFTRACAPGEQLLQLRVGNKWVVVVSMGCLNLVNAPVLGPVPAPLVMTGGGFTPPPGCTGAGCEPPPPPPCTTKCEPPPPPPPPCQGKDCKPEKPKGNNGWGNGDQSAPGNSGPNNNAENNGNETGDKPDPSHGGNAGGNGNGQGGGQGGGNGKGNGKEK